MAGLCQGTPDGPKINYQFTWFWEYVVVFPPPLDFAHPGQPNFIWFISSLKQGRDSSLKKQGTTTNRTRRSYKLLVFMGDAQSNNNSKLLWKLGGFPCPCVNQCVGAGVRNELRTGQESSPVLTRKNCRISLTMILFEFTFDPQGLVGVRIDPWHAALLFKFLLKKYHDRVFE